MPWTEDTIIQLFSIVIAEQIKYYEIWYTYLFYET
jgi:hypothetical protein